MGQVTQRQKSVRLHMTANSVVSRPADRFTNLFNLFIENTAEVTQSMHFFGPFADLDLMHLAIWVAH